jgi:hypothetical protein
MIVSAQQKPVTVRPALEWAVILPEDMEYRIASCRVLAIAKALERVLITLDTPGGYRTEGRVQGPVLPYCVVDNLISPPMAIAETLDRITAALLMNQLHRIDPNNKTRYTIRATKDLDYMEGKA